jgi:hypothetical protein
MNISTLLLGSWDLTWGEGMATTPQNSTLGELDGSGFEVPTRSKKNLKHSYAPWGFSVCFFALVVTAFLTFLPLLLHCMLACVLVLSIWSDLRLVTVTGGSYCLSWKTWQRDQALRLMSARGGWYRPHYRLPLGLVDSSDVVTPDWSIWIKIWLFEYEFDNLN